MTSIPARVVMWFSFLIAESLTTIGASFALMVSDIEFPAKHWFYAAIIITHVTLSIICGCNLFRACMSWLFGDLK